MNPEISLENIKEKILIKALKIIPFKGWNLEALREASLNAEFDDNLAELIFLDGVDGLADYYFSHLDNLMISSLSKIDINNLKIRERVFEAIKARINLLAKDKAVTIRTVTYLSMPWNMPLGNRLVWRTVDLIWYEVCNDRSTDFNYYTKRFLLYIVYTSTVLYWLSDSSARYNDTFDFLKRKIDNVLKMGNFIYKLKKTSV
jgi:ubiquinone biosynthesis protein COQ9